MEYHQKKSAYNIDVEKLVTPIPQNKIGASWVVSFPDPLTLESEAENLFHAPSCVAPDVCFAVVGTWLN